MIRKVTKAIKGVPVQDGAGVKLTRVLGNWTIDAFDPFLMLDAFDSTNPDEYMDGFPMHPHRGIETVTFISRGSMVHQDHLGTKATVTNGEAQWLTAGSGAFHSEMPGRSPRFLGVQLWLNLPARDKMTAEPFYHGITRDQIKEFDLDGGKLRLLTGSYGKAHGFQGKYLPLDYYDILLEPHAKVTLDVPGDRSVMAFTLVGDATVSGTPVGEKTAVRLGDGDQVTIEAGDSTIEFLLMSSVRLNEPVAWLGPIVMNTDEELAEAFNDIDAGTFVRQEAGYDNRR